MANDKYGKEASGKKYIPSMTSLPYLSFVIDQKKYTRKGRHFSANRILGKVFLLLWIQIEFGLALEHKENCRHDHY